MCCTLSEFIFTCQEAETGVIDGPERSTFNAEKQHKHITRYL